MAVCVPSEGSIVVLYGVAIYMRLKCVETRPQGLTVKTEDPALQGFGCSLLNPILVN